MIETIVNAVFCILFTPLVLTSLYGLILLIVMGYQWLKEHNDRNKRR